MGFFGGGGGGDGDYIVGDEQFIELFFDSYILQTIYKAICIFHLVLC